MRNKLRKEIKRSIERKRDEYFYVKEKAKKEIKSLVQHACNKTIK